MKNRIFDLWKSDEDIPCFSYADLRLMDAGIWHVIGEDAERGIQVVTMKIPQQEPGKLIFWTRWICDDPQYADYYFDLGRHEHKDCTERLMTITGRGRVNGSDMEPYKEVLFMKEYRHNVEAVPGTDMYVEFRYRP